MKKTILLILTVLVILSNLVSAIWLPLSENRTDFLYVNVDGDTMTGDLVVDTNVNATNFYGIYDWTIGAAPSVYYLTFNGTGLSFNETYLNITIDDIVVTANSSMRSYVDNTFITLANEGNLNVNSSVYWDNETSQADLNVNDSDKLDGIDSTQFLRSDINDTLEAYYLYPNGTNPISLNHLVNKEFVELAVAGLEIDYFFTNATSDISGYYVLNNTVRGFNQTIVESFSLSSGNDQLIFNFSTTAGLPFIFLSEGIYDAHIHLDKNGGAAQTIIPRWTLSKRNSSGEFLIMTSETGNTEVTTDEQIFNLHSVFNQDVPIVNTDRLVFKLFVDITGGGSSTVRLYMEGTTNSHFTFRTPSSVLQEIFIRRDGTNKLTNNWDAGDFNISADWVDAKVNASSIQNDDWIEDSQESSLNVNRSNYWDNNNIPTDLNFKLLLTYTNITSRPTHLSNFTDNLAHVEDNVTWNQSLASTLYADISITGDNVTWNETYANTLYAILSHTILSHDTDTTGAELTSLADNSMVDALHRHSELSASDGSPDKIVYTNSDGVLFADALGTGASSGLGLDVMYGANIGTHLIVGDDLTVDTNTLFVDSGNNRVGIGTATPSQKLDVRGNINASKFNATVDCILFDSRGKICSI